MPIEDLLKRAESGDPDAMYQYAKQVETSGDDADVVMHWLRKSAERGHAKAQHDLANACAERKMIEEAFAWEQKAANQGHPEAQIYLAVYYREGIGTAINYDKYFYWCTKAAESGNTDGKHALAVCYIAGQGTTPDFDKAAHWLKQAANEGHANAKARLGAFYIEGYGVSENKNKGISLLREAVRLGDESAKEMLAELGVPESPKSGGCYIATCVYGSYDCPEVWTLRRFRDGTMARSWFGRVFIHIYYAMSPLIVNVFGGNKMFCRLCKPVLDGFVTKLRNRGVENGPYFGG